MNTYSDTAEWDHPPTGAGIRPFLSGLYYHQRKNSDFVWLSKKVTVVFMYKISYWDVISKEFTTIYKGFMW